MKQKIPFSILVLAAMTLGLTLAWIDSRPNWNDTGITVGLVILTSGTFGFLKPKYAWLWAILIGIWIPFIEISQQGTYPSLLALVFAFVGSYLGALIEKLVTPKETASV